MYATVGFCGWVALIILRLRLGREIFNGTLLSLPVLSLLLSRVLARSRFSRWLPLALKDVAQVALAVTAALPDDREQCADAPDDERGGTRELVDGEVLELSRHVYILLSNKIAFVTFIRN